MSPEPAATTTGDADATIHYCYAIARTFRADALRDLAGVHGVAVHQVAEGDLVAVTSPVPAADFDEAALRRNLEDLDWLAGVATAHSAVVDAVSASATTLPLRLATVYLDEDRVRAMLRQGRDRFAVALDRITGRVEWGVKVSTRPARWDSESERTGPPARSGRSYLRRRIAERDARETAWQRAADTADEIDRTLTALAEARRQYRPQNAQLAGGRGENVLNVAYLVAEERSAAFVDRVAALRDAATDYDVELTGPWAPYSFADGSVDAGGSVDASGSADTDGSVDAGGSVDASGSADTDESVDADGSVDPGDSVDAEDRADAERAEPAEGGTYRREAVT
jgi:hypothetical protein